MPEPAAAEPAPPSSADPTPDSSAAPLAQRIGRLWPYVRPHRLGLLVALLGAVAMAASEPMVAHLLGQLLDRGFAERNFPLWVVPAVILGVFALRGAAGFLLQYGLAWTANRAIVQLRSDLFDTLLLAPPRTYAERPASSLVNTLVFEASVGVTTLVSALSTLMRDILILLALLAYLLWLNWQLTLMVGLLFPAVAWVMRTIGRRLQRVTVEAQKANDQLAYVVEENVLAWRIVRLHAAGPRQAERFVRRAQEVRQWIMKGVVAGASMTPVTQMLAACAMSAVIVLALWQSRTSGGSVGEFVAFITAMLQLVAPIKHLSDVMAPVTRGLAAVERGLDLIAHNPPERGGRFAADATAGRATGRIDLAAVGLHYRKDGHTRAALDGVSLAVRPGETVALVGPSGAGKTTLVNLLPRFVEPDSGTVRLDGVALAEWDVRALRQQFAVVSQDVVLFNDSLAFNVSLGEAMDEARIRDALAAAHLLDFALAQPQGLATPIGHNGSQLSGGQRQRLAIARAIAKDAPVLILDEATSALDSESERAVQAALENLMRGRTTLVIAHRLSTIEHADRVVAMEHGRIVEVGSHAELLAAGGLYARLHAMQFRNPAAAEAEAA
jgi:subfamily B ATP-binding cassette protein MsbA